MAPVSQFGRLRLRPQVRIEIIRELVGRRARRRRRGHRCRRRAAAAAAAVHPPRCRDCSCSARPRGITSTPNPALTAAARLVRLTDGEDEIAPAPRLAQRRDGDALAGAILAVGHQRDRRRPDRSWSRRCAPRPPAASTGGAASITGGVSVTAITTSRSPCLRARNMLSDVPLVTVKPISGQRRRNRASVAGNPGARIVAGNADAQRLDARHCRW